MAAGIGIIENGKTNWHQLIIQNPTVRNGEVGFSGIRDSRPKLLNKSWIWVKIWRLRRPQFLVIFELSNSWAKNWPLPVWTFRFPVLLSGKPVPWNRAPKCFGDLWLVMYKFQMGWRPGFPAVVVACSLNQCWWNPTFIGMWGWVSLPLMTIFWGINIHEPAIFRIFRAPI